MQHFAEFMTHSSKLLSLRVDVGILEFSVGIRREGTVMGTMASDCKAG